MSGCDHEKSKFTVTPGKSQDDKKCFKDDCANEGDACIRCCMVQGRYTSYYPRIDKPTQNID